ncbi:MULTISPECIES: response regulator [unclassified Candidatus Sulfotelmatobacter]|uniref:response regulator n=1 Tax=unclassified Candidatus Sulfotelmatobacter TaxID=2635724 RepID=UPI00168589A3|nr:response regulator transcription factor [Kocuria sp. cx-116]MBD2763252.1 response regulator transcription factor [Kocuria sp. cx-116]
MSSIPPESAAVSRVLIVDDQPLVRGGFRMLVDSQPDLAVIGEAGDGREAVDFVAGAVGAERIPDVVLMDVRMPQLNGIEATRAILAARPQIKVIVLTTFDLDEYALDGIRAGASGFLLKDARPEELLDAIRTVARGDAVIAPSTTRRLLDHLIAHSPNDAAPAGAGPASHWEVPGNTTIPGQVPAAASNPWKSPRLAALTAREREVFELVGRGLSNGEIMSELYLSEPTVKTHVSHILAKLGARDRVQAVVIAYETGVVTA